MLIELSGQGPRYLQIYEALRQAILDARLSPGTRLPASRGLAADLGVSRNVVLAAYDQLMAEGYTEAAVGSGTYVARNLPEELLAAHVERSTDVGPAPLDQDSLSDYGRRLDGLPGGTPEDRYRGPLRYDFRYGTPSVTDFPHEAWKRLVSKALRKTTLRALNYGPPEGDPALREALASYLGRSRGVRCTPEQVLVVNGSQQGLDLIARIMIDPGDRVIIEEPHYPGAREVFEASGADLAALPVDEQGLDTSLLAGAGPARLAYVTPSHQFPSGALMSASRRLALLGWAEDGGAYILEDDYDSEFRYRGRPLQAVQGLDTGGRVLYLGTLSKVLFPSVRLGYLVLPKPLLPLVRKAKQLADSHTPMLSQQVLTLFISEGHFERHLRRARRANAQRRAVLLESLERRLGDRVEVMGENAGIHVVVWLKGKTNARRLAEQAYQRGVGLYPISAYYLGRAPREGLLVGYGSLTERQIREGVEVVAELLEEPSTLATAPQRTASRESRKAHH